VYAGCVVGEAVLIADLATIRESVSVGARTIVGRGVAIENSSTIGSRCKLETNAYITAYSTIEDDVFVAPGVLTSNDNYLGRSAERFEHFGGVTIRRGGRLGVGAVILPNLTVGEDAVVAAGALLTRDAPDEVIVAGLPAREFKAVPENQKLSNQ
jgi:UDP-2-acetamido-3-amino-2,3-dideoxy-glucuronate N-acetyltransferase